MQQLGTGSSSLSGQTATGGLISFVGPVTVSGTASLDASSNSQTITFSNTIDGPGNLTLATGDNDITFLEDIGDTTSLGTLTITTARNVTTQAVTAGAFIQSAGTGTTLLNSDINTNGSGGINLTGAAFTFLGDATTTNGGPITIANELTTSAHETLSSDGAFSQTGAGDVFLAGSITTNSADLSFSGPVTLTAPVTLNTGSGTGSITFAETVDGNQSLTMTAGDGDILFSGAVGGTTPIGALTINSVNNFTSNVALNAASITQISGTGTYTVQGTVSTTAPAGINLTGNDFVRIGAAVTTTNGGSVTVNNSGSITGSGTNTTTVDGSYLQTGTGPVHLAGTIHAIHGTISFSGPITLVCQ